MIFFKFDYLLTAVFLLVLIFSQVNLAYAAPPVVESSAGIQVTPTDARTGTITIPNVSIGTQSDRLLTVTVALDNHDIASIATDTTVTSVTFGPTGTSCSVNQSFTLVPGSVIQIADHVRNEIWSLTAPTQSQTCNIIVTLSDDVGDYGGLFDKRAAAASYSLFSRVDQTTPIVGNTGVTNSDATGTSNTPSVTIASTADQYATDIMSSSSSSGVAPTIGPNQSLQFSYFTSGIVNFLTGASTQSGNLDTSMSWTFTNTANWASSAIVINSCDTSASCTVASGGSDNSDNYGGHCDQNCVSPTLGKFYTNRMVVENGFSYNENTVDVTSHSTLFPLVTTSVGEKNTLSLILYEDEGPQNIAHVGVAFGLKQGDIFNDSQIIINWDRNFDGSEMVSVIDSENVLDNVEIIAEEKDCTIINSQCLYITFYHAFRTSLDSNIVSVDVWDFNRNGKQNYFDPGILVLDDPLDLVETHNVVYKGKTYQLIEIAENKSVDANGDDWILEDNAWKKITPETDSALVNYDKLYAIKYLDFDNSFNDASDAISYHRYSDHFSVHQIHQMFLAESIMEELCPKCLDDPYEEIDDIFSYDEPIRYKQAHNPDLQQTLEQESSRASLLLDDMMALHYPGMVFEESDIAYYPDDPISNEPSGKSDLQQTLEQESSRASEFLEEMMNEYYPGLIYD
ncbi:hypothetical protein [Nitrosopumilus sp.]|uniref:hypothetical protein n=1 Tax=Nitrosopumilus sp. TaxID=2024843 RepID=UPI00261B86B6|nr:hypothetical protein [Nitrosopumilus sp.]